MSGQELVLAIMGLIRRYVALTEGQALTVALWSLNSWVYEHFPVCPYLEIWALHKRSGKSTLAEILSALSRGGRVLATVRALQMVRNIEALQGAYVPFLEEAERFWKGSLGDERAILATGYRRGAFHELASTKGELLRFRTYSPKCFVLIGNVHDILRDRCISIKLERQDPERNWTRERDTATTEISTLIKAYRDLARSGGLEAIQTEDGPRFHVVDPHWLTSARDREIWMPLFSLANALRLHKGTIELLQRASVDLSVLKSLPAIRYSPSQEENVGDDMNAATAVLRDALSVIRDGERNVATVDLLARLHAIPTAPWRAFRGEGLNADNLAVLFSRFGVQPTTVQIGKGRKDRKVAKGYKVIELVKASKLK